VEDTEKAVGMCMTSDTLTSPGGWWTRRIVGNGRHSAMSDEVYFDIVSRYVVIFLV
jgi:hypothetical protein